VDKIALTLGMMSPGITLMVVAFVLIVRSRKTGSLWGARLFYLGFALLFLGPGLVIGTLALIGQMQLPALFAGAWAILLGCGALYSLRLHWDDPFSKARQTRRPPD
jgi:hypothetical protein